MYPVHVAHLPFQADLNYKLVCLDNFEGHPIYSEMNTGDW
jgi:hypothetical protein